MTIGPIVTSVWEGFRAVDYIFGIKGSLSNPLPGTIRFEYCLSQSNTVMHSSGSVEDAKREIDVYFNETEFVPWEWANSAYIHAGSFISFVEP